MMEHLSPGQQLEVTMHRKWRIGILDKLASERPFPISKRSAHASRGTVADTVSLSPVAPVDDWTQYFKNMDNPI